MIPPTSSPTLVEKLQEMRGRLFQERDATPKAAMAAKRRELDSDCVTIDLAIAALSAPERPEGELVDLSQFEGHTPGPWAWEAVGEKANEWCVGLIMAADINDDRMLSGQVQEGEGVVVDGIAESISHNYRDAALIAAAPQLLAEVRMWRSRTLRGDDMTKELRRKVLDGLGMHEPTCKSRKDTGPCNCIRGDALAALDKLVAAAQSRETPPADGYEGALAELQQVSRVLHVSIPDEHTERRCANRIDSAVASLRAVRRPPHVATGVGLYPAELEAHQSRETPPAREPVAWTVVDKDGCPLRDVHDQYIASHETREGAQKNADEWNTPPNDAEDFWRPPYTVRPLVFADSPSPPSDRQEGTS